MIFPIKTEQDVVMMDDTDMREHMLLTSFDEKQRDNDDKNNKSSSTLDTTPALMEEDDDVNDNEFLDTEKVGTVTPKTEEQVEKPSEATTPKATNTTSQSPSTKTETTTTSSTEKKTSSDPAKVGIPSKFDILCGQSRICANHTGNRRFQVVLDIYAPRYDAATTKQEKMALTKEIVGCIASANGRFLKYHEGLWQEISTVTARDKVSHALRTKVASWKRQQQQKSSPKDEKSPTKKSRPTHRRKNSSGGRRRSSASSVATTGSDIFTSSFDGSDPAATSIMDDLLKSQREIFATLTSSEHSPKKSSPHPLKK